MNVRKIRNKKIPKAIIFGIAGKKLTNVEKEFFKKTNPLGFILFERNCKNFHQLKDLVKDLKNSLSHNYPLIMIDQEGGRVARLKKPHWKKYPPADFFGKKAENNLAHAKKLVFENSRNIAKDLKNLGINVNCAPVLDVKYPFTHSVIGNRAFSNNPDIVSELGKIFCKGLKCMGIIPELKHIPGHGPSKVDSHKLTPIVEINLKDLIERDFLPFKKLNNQPFAMIAHIIYSKIDSSLACTSQFIIKNIIKKKIRFKGLLISDDINMKALKGSLTSRVINILNSGCNIILHCNGKIKEMRKIQKVIPHIDSVSFKKIVNIKKKFNN